MAITMCRGISPCPFFVNAGNMYPGCKKNVHAYPRFVRTIIAGLPSEVDQHILTIKKKVKGRYAGLSICLLILRKI